MKTILNTLILISIVILSYGCNTIHVISNTDIRYLNYIDSLNAYNTAKSVCDTLAILFYKYTGNHDYDSYFLRPWKETLSYGDAVDTLLGYSEYQENTEYPDTLDGNIFQSRGSLGEDVKNQLDKLKQLKIKPFAKVVGAEMPTVYIYKKPDIRVIYGKPERCWIKKRRYTILDNVTYFITDEKGFTRIPYNILRYYEEDKLVKTQWVDTQNINKVYKTFVK